MSSPDTRAPARRRWLRLVVGVALSAGALALAVRKTSLEEVALALEQGSWGWVPVIVALKALVLVVKDLRWRVELEAMAPGPYQRTFRAIGLGYFGNLLLPFKLGEVLRASLLRRHNPQVTVGEVLATVGAERTLDGAVLAAMVALALGSAEVPPWVMRGTVLLIAVMLVILLLSMVEPVHRLALRLLPERNPWGIARRVVAALSRGTRVLRAPRALALAGGLTAVAWLGEALALYCAVCALGLPLAFKSALVVTLLLAVGLLIPSAPGQIGTHQALTVLFLQPFGISAAAAVSLSVVLQATTLCTLGSIGGYVLVREAGARDLVRRSQQGDLPPA